MRGVARNIRRKTTVSSYEFRVSSWTNSQLATRNSQPMLTIENDKGTAAELGAARVSGRGAIVLGQSADELRRFRFRPAHLELCAEQRRPFRRNGRSLDRPETPAES